MHAVLAHQGGWDEILLVAVPIAVIIGLLALVKHRVDASALRGSPAEPTAPTRASDELTPTERE